MPSGGPGALQQIGRLAGREHLLRPSPEISRVRGVVYCVFAHGLSAGLPLQQKAVEASVEKPMPGPGGAHKIEGKCGGCIACVVG